jgi:hypothetical protein
VLILDLATRNLDTLVGHPDRRVLQFGRLGLTVPHEADPATCASLAELRALCAGPGEALVLACSRELAIIPGGLWVRHPEDYRAAVEPGPALPAIAQP